MNKCCEQHCPKGKMQQHKEPITVECYDLTTATLCCRLRSALSTSQKSHLQRCYSTQHSESCCRECWSQISVLSHLDLSHTTSKWSTIHMNWCLNHVTLKKLRLFHISEKSVCIWNWSPSPKISFKIHFMTPILILVQSLMSVERLKLLHQVGGCCNTTVTQSPRFSLQ